MENNKNDSLVQAYIEKYSKEEFQFILSLLPHSKLLEPIKKNNKEFRMDIKGFSRLDKLPIEKLQDIYYTRVYKKKDEVIAKDVDRLVHQYLQEIDKTICVALGSFKVFDTKIKENDMNYFEKLVTLLLETKQEKNVPLYFKMKDYELSKEQREYLSNDIKYKIEAKKAEAKIKNELNEIHEKKIRDLEEGYSTLITDKEHQIKRLEQQLVNEKKYFEFEMSNQKDIINALGEKYSQQISKENKYKDKIKSLKESLENLKKESADKDKQIKELTSDLNKEYDEFHKLTNENESLKGALENIKKEYMNKDNQIKKLTDLLDKKYDEFHKIVREKWVENNKELTQQNEKIKASIESLKSDRDKILKETEALNALKGDLEEKISFVEGSAGKFLSNIKEVFSVLGIEKSNEKSSGSNLYRISSQVLEAEVEDIENVEYFIDDLSTNLNICGINNEYTFDLAQYIYATFANKMSLLLVGYNTRKVANAISYITAGIEADIISLPLGYNDYIELIGMVKDSQSKIILIENAVDTVSENVYMPLIKENQDKLLIFSMESSENISLIPKSVFNYMVMVDLDLLLGFESNDEMLKGLTNIREFDTSIDASLKSSNLRTLNKLESVIKLSNSHKLKIAEIMSIIQCLKSENSLYDVLLFYISLLCKSSSKLDELTEFIDSQEFNATAYKMLKAVLGKDSGDE
jgi:hypothetical protein